jgi:hypothetical protein
VLEPNKKTNAVHRDYPIPQCDFGLAETRRGGRAGLENFLQRVGGKLVRAIKLEVSQKREEVVEWVAVEGECVAKGVVEYVGSARSNSSDCNAGVSRRRRNSSLEPKRGASSTNDMSSI